MEAALLVIVSTVDDPEGRSETSQLDLIRERAAEALGINS